jgi:beta-glucosidase
MKKVLSLALLGIAVLSLSFCKGNKTDNSERLIYKDKNAKVEERVEDLLSRMTLDEKIGQMTEVCRDVYKKGDIANMNLGSILSGGGSTPRDNTVEGWQKMISDMQADAASTRLGIPIIYGIDSVHGNNNLLNSTIFPHNIGLGASGDKDLVKRIGEAVAEETVAAGIPWTYAPCLAVVRDVRWGRTYESFGQNETLSQELGEAFVEGFQNAKGLGIKPAACAKHYLGDGNTVYGTSQTSSRKLDQGDMKENDDFIRTVLLPSYKKAIEQGVLTVMPSFSSWNGVKMHANKYLLTDVLKGELGFKGFVISDWQALDQVDPDYYTAIVTCINAGVDMNMCPYDGKKFIKAVKDAVEKGDIQMSRIDDAVSRILYVKFTMGLFENPVPGASAKDKVRSKEHLALAREAVAKSLVVLKNTDNILPIKDSTKKIYVGGNGASNMGAQCGGWTMTWQGKEGNITKGTTIFQAISKAASDKAEVSMITESKIDDADASGLCIIVIGEKPYAEYEGDSDSIALSSSDKDLFEKASEKFENVILVTVSGRPVIITEQSEKAKAVVAAWLPGTEGDGVADILFGKVKPTGKLNFDWPKSVEDLPAENFISGKKEPLYPIGTGLSY